MKLKGEQAIYWTRLYIPGAVQTPERFGLWRRIPMKDEMKEQLFYTLTLKSHYEREIQKGEPYSLPGEQVWKFARTRGRLQELMNQLDPGGFPEEDRESNGLILCLDPAKLPALVETKDGFLQQTLALPKNAITKTVVAPRKTVHFIVPEGLVFGESPIPLRDQIGHTLAAFPKIMLVSVLIGISVVLFQAQIGKLITNKWLNFFLNNGNGWEIAGIVSLFCAGLFYWLVILSRLKIELVGTDNELVSIVQNLLNIPRRFDPGVVEGATVPVDSASRLEVPCPCASFSPSWLCSPSPAPALRSPKTRPT